MIRTITTALALCAAATLVARADEPPPTGPPAARPTVDAAAGARAFATVARVLQSPRCQNCHPAGDRPLQGDRGRRHPIGLKFGGGCGGLAAQLITQMLDRIRLGKRQPGGKPFRGSQRFACPGQLALPYGQFGLHEAGELGRRGRRRLQLDGTCQR